MPITVAQLKLAHSELTHQIIGAFYDVYNALGYGFVESVYAKALPIALATRGLRCQTEVPLPVFYRSHRVGEFRADMIVSDTIIVEIKAVERIVEAHERQLLNYLKASGLTVGLILNFGPRPSTRRFIGAEKSSGTA